MNTLIVLLSILTCTELYFTGFGITFILLCVGRVCYGLNTMGSGFRVRTCIKWECAALGWVILKAIIFKSVIFNWKYTLLIAVYGVICTLIELHDEITYSYIVEDLEEDNNEEESDNKL